MEENQSLPDLVSYNCYFISQNSFFLFFLQKEEEIIQLEKEINPLLSDDPQVISSRNSSIHMTEIAI